MDPTTKTPHLPGKFIWFEHASDDPAKARAFYEPLFGWHVEAMPMGGEPYHMLLNGNVGIGGLSKPAKAGTPAHWVSYMSAESVDRAVQAAQAAGARVEFPPTDFPPVGRGAGLVDPTGSAFCLWTSTNGDEPDADVPVGGFVWNELSTPDAKKSLAFYEQAFGYTHSTMDMGDQGTYYILETAGQKGRAGLFEPKEPMPAMWLPYVNVADCDATFAKAQALGAGFVAMPPTSIPTVGRIAIFGDPQGAAIGIIQPDPGMKT
jgi:predicted enzyme related to lactoylglutathione lyase